MVSSLTRYDELEYKANMDSYKTNYGVDLAFEA